MTEPIAPITVVPGYLIDYGGTGGAIQTVLPLPSAISFMATGEGTYALNRRVSGRQGVLEVWWIPSTQVGIANIASLVLGSAHISLAASATDRVSAYVTNGAGVDVATLTSGSAPAFTAGRMTKVSLKWDTVAGTVAAYLDDVLVTASLWGVSPSAGWPYFQPTTLVTANPTGSLIELGGTIQRVTVRDISV